MYAVLFLLAPSESLGARKIISAPEAIEAESVESAKKEGLEILNELPPHHRESMKPLSIVEVNDNMLEELSGCERIFLSNIEDDGELEFADVSDTSFWSTQAWWHR